MDKSSDVGSDVGSDLAVTKMYMTSNVNGTGLKCVQKQYITPIPYFVPEAWSRHGYTWHDIDATFKASKSQQLWPHALSLGLPVDASAVKPGYSSEMDMVGGAKHPAVSILKQHARNTGYVPPTNGADCLIMLPGRHIPVPNHVLSPGDYDVYAGGLEQRRVFQWNKICCATVGVEADGQALLMVRVIPTDVYDEIFDPQKDCLGLQPLIPVAGWCATDEFWVFSQKRLTSSKKTQRKSIPSKMKK